MHDNAVIKPTGGKYTDLLEPISIGNNCFIGFRATILGGVHLADNTIVGVGSVVTKSVTTPGLVIAGNPARIISTVEEYITKNQKQRVDLDGMNLEKIQKLIKDNPELLIERKPMA